MCLAIYLLWEEVTGSHVKQVKDNLNCIFFLLIIYWCLFSVFSQLIFLWNALFFGVTAHCKGFSYIFCYCLRFLFVVIACY